MARHPQTFLLAGLVVLVAGSASAAPPATPSPALPALPAGGGTGPAPASTPTGPDLEQLRRGVVQIEQAGRPMAVGMVLSKDGRVLTSLSALGTTEAPDVRYADNTVVKTKLLHKDKGWDLALLVPQTGRWLDGLMPTDADPTGLEIKAFLPKAGKLAGVGIGLKGRTDARTKEGDALHSVLDLDLKGITGIPGAPLLEPGGKVIGVLSRVCKDTPAHADAEKNHAPTGGGSGSGGAGGGGAAAPAASGADKVPVCAPITIGVPVTALRGFLMKTPATAVQPAPWLGLGGAPTESGNVKGIRVMGVAPGSPAEKAGLKATGENPDTIVAVDGQPVETPEQLAEVIAKRAVGQTVKLLVFSQGKFREVPVMLRPAP